MKHFFWNTWQPYPSIIYFISSCGFSILQFKLLLFQSALTVTAFFNFKSETVIRHSEDCSAYRHFMYLILIQNYLFRPAALAVIWQGAVVAAELLTCSSFFSYDMTVLKINEIQNEKNIYVCVCICRYMYVYIC